MGFVFVSIVGEQAMSVLNPLSIILQEAGNVLDAVHFLFTPKTVNNSEIFVRTSQGLIKEQLGRTDIPVIPASISDTLKNINGLVPVHEYLENLQKNTPVLFNLAGGMSFQVAAAVNTLMKQENNTYIYPEDNGCQLASIKNGNLTRRAYSRKKPLPLDVFKIQGTEFKVIRKKNTELDDYLSSKSLNTIFPSHAKRRILIGDLLFDFLWNQSNKIVFVTSLFDNKKSEDNLRKARKIIRFAESRESADHLFSRDLFVVTDAERQAERLKGYDKIKVIKVHETMDSTSAKEVLSDIFRFKALPPFVSSQHKRITHQIRSGKCTSSVYMVLGTRLLISLTAMYSHKADHTLFFYTPGDPTVEAYKDCLTTNAKEFPWLKKLSFVPIDITGLKILDCPGPSEPLSAVNITPGTKAQSAYLSFFAARHRMDQCSCDNRSSRLTTIASWKTWPIMPEEKLDGPDPVFLLKLKGEVVLPFQDSAPQHDKNHFQGLTRFIEMHQSEKRCFPEKFPYPGNKEEIPRIVLDGAVYDSCQGNGNKACLTFDMRNPLVIDLNQDLWFEQWVGYQIKQCGADDVYVRMRIGVKPNSKTYKDDLDVVARFGSRYYMISCKVGKGDDSENFKESKNAEAQAKLIDGFCTAMICRFKHTDAPQVIDKTKTYVFGYTTLKDTALLSDLLDKAYIMRQSTQQ